MKTFFLLSFFSLSLLSKDVKISSHNNTEKGMIEKIYDFQSNYVDSRPIYVWLPPNFDPKKKHDLLIMHDGQNLFDGTKTWNGQEWELDEWAAKLISENEISSFIILGIHNSGKKRWSDYFPEKAYSFIADSSYLGGVKPELNADQYLKYIVKEVIPFIERKYLKSSYDYKKIIGGSSMGGLISMYAAFEYPNVFVGFIKVNDFQSPIRIESYNYPKNLINDYSYILAVSKLLPSYSYPVGLHVVDRFVKIPQWMKKASKNYWSTHALKSVMNNQNKGPNSLVLKYISNKNRTWANRPKNKGGRIEK